MRAPTIIFYISGHGFGHASRQIEVINTLRPRRPELGIVVRTAAARWLFELTAAPGVELSHADVDTGIVQIDSLALDEAESVRRAAAFHWDAERLIRRELAFLDAAGARLVVADIPPLACAVARERGIPALAVSNFTWDWIYEGYPEALAAAPDLVPTIQAMYRAAPLALRLPLHGGFESFARVVDVPFIARRSRRDPADVRRALGLPLDRPLVLVSFGGYGLRGLDWSAVSRLTPYGIVVTTELPGAELPPPEADTAIFRVGEGTIYGSGLRYEDLVAACDVVATKPGYSIIAECVANGTALLYTSRGRFVEYDVLVAGLPRYVRAEFIKPADLRAGRWKPSLDRLLAQPPPPERPAVDGAEVVVDYIESLVDSR